jgi:hypothetical protein
MVALLGGMQKGGKSGLRRARCWVTPSPGDGKESATENRPPSQSLSDWARVKRRGKSSPLRWRQRRHGKPHLEQDQVVGRLRAARPSPRVGRLTSIAILGLDE